MDKLYIVMPAYNEEGTIEKVVDEWHTVVESIGNNSKLVVINDGSKDNTAGILEEIKNNYANLIVINKKNTGHGPTCTAAYKYVVAEGADWVFQTDSDGQTKSSDFTPFWEKRKTSDFIIGWRVKRSDGLIRLFISQILKIILLIVFRVMVKDANTPFRLMRIKRLREYLPAIPENYFLPNTLLSVMITKNKEKVFWQKISFSPRKSGISSMPFMKVVRRGMPLINQLCKMRKTKLPK